MLALRHLGSQRLAKSSDFVVRGLGELTEPIDSLTMICISSSIPLPLRWAVSEALCNEAADRPVVLLNPQLEDVAVVGIGYAARQLRERFPQPN